MTAVEEHLQTGELVDGLYDCQGYADALAASDG